jgi:uncharacterized protein YidB (DUF937 family)
MGLLDILNGMQNGPRGAREPAPAGASSGGMSPMMMALLGLLAYKAVQSGGLGNMLGGGTQNPQAADAGAGGLGDMLGGLLGGSAPAGSGAAGGLGGILGGLLGGGAAGTALSGGLGSLLQGLQESGQGDVAQSWVGPGPNRAIEPNALASAIGADTLDALSRQTGMPQDELLSGLSQNLPQFVDQLTPNGRLPTEQEASRWI